MTKDIITIRDKRIGLKGYLVIDSEINGSSTGGIRMLPNITLKEIKDLARVMTLKQSFIGIPKGGARAGIVIKDDTSENRKQQLLNKFGKKISKMIIDKRYLPAVDMGTSRTLITNMYRHIGYSPSKTSTVSKNSGYYTSLSMLVAIVELCRALRIKPYKATFAIEGFGKVGSSISALLHDLDAKIVSISTINGAIYNKRGLSVPKALALKEKYGDKWIKHYKNAGRIKKEKLLELSVDVLCLCGRSYQINRSNMTRVKAKSICAGANNPVTQEADHYLFNKGIIYLPDFMTNCGGVLGNAMEFMGLDQISIIKFLTSSVGTKFRKVIKLSGRLKKSPLVVGKNIAIQRLRKIETLKNKKTLKNVTLKLGLNAYRKGLIPKWAVRKYATNYFNHIINSHSDMYENLNT